MTETKAGCPAKSSRLDSRLGSVLSVCSFVPDSRCGNSHIRARHAWYARGERHAVCSKDNAASEKYLGLFEARLDCEPNSTRVLSLGRVGFLLHCVSSIQQSVGPGGSRAGDVAVDGLQPET